MDELRRKGLEKMNEVYGWEMPDMPRRLLRAHRRPPLRHHLDAARSVDARQADDDADRASPRWASSDLAEIQANAALANGELTVEELKEMAIFLTHYLGFPLGSKLDGVGHQGGQAAQEGCGEGRGRGQEGQRQRRAEHALGKQAR